LLREGEREMREIKLRAWSIYNHEMIYPQKGEDMTDKITSASLLAAYNDGGNDYLMQYTGLKDKNGNDIYEGDVVELQNPKNQIQKMKLSGVVIFSFASFGVEIKRVDEWLGYNVEPPEMVWFLNSIDMKIFEVIGNIYQRKATP